MPAIRFSILKAGCSAFGSETRVYRSCMKFVKCANRIDARSLLSCINRPHHTKESGFAQKYANCSYRMMGFKLTVGNQDFSTNHVSAFSYTLLNPPLKRNASLVGISYLLNCRSYSSSIGNQGDNTRVPEAPAASDATGPNVSDSDLVGNDMLLKVKQAWHSAVDYMSYTAEKAKETSTDVTPHIQQFLDAHPYLRDVLVPVSGLLTGTLLAWVVMPGILRRFYKYSMQGPATLLSGSSLWGPVPYENSIWGALEHPVKYLITFMAFSEIVAMVAPTTFASQYIGQVWRGAFILSFVWFLHRWKTNVISRALAAKSVGGLERDKLLTLDKISSVGLFAIGLMSLAEACGVAVQSILTVGGIGGVATAFAARDILGNILSGLSVQISRPFSVGDTIKAGSVEGQVVEMGLTTTSLLSAERFPVIVPNSIFSSQVIVNKSRAQWRAVVSKIPLQIDDFDKIPLISDDIKSMLKSNINVFLEKEAPYCFMSRVERSYAELTLGCNLKYMSKDQLYSAQQDILLQSVRIIKQHGATLGSTLEDYQSVIT